MGPMIVALAGLPGTGKSVLARALSEATGWPVFDKDRVRAALFGPGRIEGSAGQDDFCAHLTYEAATWTLRSGRSAGAILDGRTYARPGTLEPLLALREALPGLRLALVECSCAEAVACARLARDAEAGDHPAPDRGPDLYRSLASRAVPLAPPVGVLHLRIATDAAAPPDQPVKAQAEALATRVLAALGSLAPDPG